MTSFEKRSLMETYIRLQNESLLSLKAMLESVGFSETVALKIVNDIQSDVFSGKKDTGEKDVEKYVNELSKLMPIMAELGQTKSVGEDILRSIKLTKLLVWRIQENYARLALTMED